MTADALITAIQRRLTDISDQQLSGGGLISYGPDTTDQYRQAAGLRSHPRGGETRNLPVQPTKYDLVINLETAKALRIELPPTMCARARADRSVAAAPMGAGRGDSRVPRTRGDAGAAGFATHVDVNDPGSGAPRAGRSCRAF